MTHFSGPACDGVPLRTAWLKTDDGRVDLPEWLHRKAQRLVLSARAPDQKGTAE